jgi:hypothetical protein
MVLVPSPMAIWTHIPHSRNCASSHYPAPHRRGAAACDRGARQRACAVNRLIRPIRCDYLKLLTLDPWDDDPNPRFDFESSQRWMRRFDRNSEWPDLDTRLKHTPPEKRTAALRCMPNERVPQSGLWWTPAIKGAGGQRQFEAGQSFPSIEETDWGKVIWYLD